LEDDFVRVCVCGATRVVREVRSIPIDICFLAEKLEAFQSTFVSCPIRFELFKMLGAELRGLPLVQDLGGRARA
jgi:hypothetical protein